MPAPLLFLPGNGSLDGRDRSGVITASASGALRYATGQNGQQAFFIEEGTTNYFTNPVLNSASTGWQAFASVDLAMTSGRVSTQTDMSPFVWEVVCTDAVGAAGSSVINFINVTTGALTGSITPSSVVKANRAISVSLITRMKYTDLSQEDTIVIAALPTTATRITFPTATINAGKTLATVFAMVSVYQPNLQVGDTIWQTKAQIENKAYATSYCDGSLGTGYAWTGTAHASTSTRAASGVTIPTANHLNKDQGELWVRVSYGPADTDTAARYAVYHTSFGVNRLYVQRIVSSKKLSIGFGSSENVLPESGTTSDGAIVSQAISWQGANVTHLKDGGIVSSTSTLALATLDPTLFIGATSATSSNINGTIQDLLIFDRPLTTGERSKLANTPVWSWGILDDGPIPGLLLPV